jgi:hypothetical protein
MPPLDDVAGRCKRALVITEGLLVYLDAADVVVLAKDFHACSSFAFWAMDVAPPPLLAYARRGRFRRALDGARAPFRFAPKEGADFFCPFGWQVVDFRSTVAEALRRRRAPLYLRAMRMTVGVLGPARPGSPRAQWLTGGIALLERAL